MKFATRGWMSAPAAALFSTLSWVAVAVAPAPAPAPFNAIAAWHEFDELVRFRYAYLQRLGVDGDAILRHFAPLAEATATPAAFIDVLQLTAHNFADPHFIVGPLDNQDFAIFPTSADLYAQRVGDTFRIVDVREGSDAERQGVTAGAPIALIDGRSPEAAIELVMGLPIATLSPQQADAGINIALAGQRHHRRLLVLGPAKETSRFDLAPGNDLADAVGKRSPLTVARKRGVAVIKIENSLGNNDTIAAFAAALAQVKGVPTLVIDLRNTPSGGNTTVARGIMGHFITGEHAYQVHRVPGEERQFGVPRKFVEYVLPIRPHYAGRVIVLGGHWTGSMGEGLMIGFEAIGVHTAGSRLAHLLGALSNEQLDLSGARVDIGEEQLFDIRGRPREAFIPDLHIEREEAHGDVDPLLDQAVRSFH